MDWSSSVANHRPTLQPETYSAWSSELCEGSHNFTIMNYSTAKGIGIGKHISSDKFEVGGCWWQIFIYPDGENNDVADYISFFLTLVSGGSDTRATFKLFLLDQYGEKKHMLFDSQRANKFQAIYLTWGWAKFMKRDEFEASNFLKDDCLHIRCTISVILSQKTIKMNRKEITLPPNEITLHLQSLMESGIGSDVTFDVNGDLFSAHKSILAARSSVFKALFFGSMKDEGVHPIKILGMEAPVFKILLHFIYCDDLPELNEFKSMNLNSLFQHLLAAADQYDLGRLKMICASYLSTNISINTATSIWALADRHDCSTLKSCCIEFVASLKTPQDVMQTSDFKEIKESDPLMALEFLHSAFVTKQRYNGLV